MNIYLIIIISALVVDFLLSNISQYLTLKSLSPVLPEEFSGVYDNHKYEKSQNYTRENIKFASIQSVFSFIITLLFILYGGFNYIDIFVREYTNHPIFGGLFFIGLLFIMQDFLSMPFNLYQTFRIEKKYGFNKMTPRLYITDKLKGYLLTIILGSLVMGSILYVFEFLGNLAWLTAWIIMTVLTFVLPPLYINFIAPLFNKFTPLEDGDLKDKLTNYAKKVSFPLKGVFVMDGSKRSTHSNAYFTGFGKNKRIVLFDTLMKTHESDELLGIIAHEVGHYKRKHILKGMIISIIHTGVLLYLMSLFINNPHLFSAFKMTHLSVYASLLFFGLLFSPIDIILSVVMNYYSRKNEFEADTYAVETTNNGNAFIDGLKNLSLSNLSNLTPHFFTVFLSYSHPPVLERVRNIREIIINSEQS
ncbi:MAG: M48 family metallopeptidase [Candidatus Marinimicrobia bacterium]|jgi:STE24 endopeptidase|nr:M48 family metallopeptidase [Candidatus Neomarinimicrobiota bacterium]MBT3633197.1 M48 family metallopeptidase [Candidatus Neomarinimicrobiota bacterium]MBT3682202.1 M48 family metallopeptidase [Candidatus Neomarinimicrobiota bacterium]MBT3758797.1 M48 family metallopeptidase [Candidatus Neomarinimicrobiota bacterium]MBT3895328.1 M48 family metallopeptidase [Candidatus Neomarinimicrobiota bacterium]